MRVCVCARARARVYMCVRACMSECGQTSMQLSSEDRTGSEAVRKWTEEGRSGGGRSGQERGHLAGAPALAVRDAAISRTLHGGRGHSTLSGRLLGGAPSHRHQSAMKPIFPEGRSRSFLLLLLVLFFLSFFPPTAQHLFHRYCSSQCCYYCFVCIAFWRVD